MESKMTESRHPPEHILEKNKALELLCSKATGIEDSLHFVRGFNSSILEHWYLLNDKWKEDDIDSFFDGMRNIIKDFDYNFTRYEITDYLVNVRIKQKEGSGLISFYPTLLDIWKGKRVEVKPGKFFRFLFPFLKDTEVESLVAGWKAVNLVPEFDLIVSQEESAFVDAYSTDFLPKRSPRFNNGENFYLKRLDSSCMQGKWRSDNHPAKVYASGDFWIAYTKEKITGKIGSRVIYTEESASNIYSVDDKASQILVDYLKELGVSNYARFEGKKVKRIPNGTDHQILMPYIDGYSKLEKFDESFMIISHNQSRDTGIYCNETQGYTYEIGRLYCECCNERRVTTHGNQVWSSSHNQINVCNSCLDGHYVYSQELEAYIHGDNAIINPENPEDYVTERWLRHEDYVLCFDSEYRKSEDCVYVEEDYYPVDSNETEQFNGVYYLKDSEELLKLKRGKATQTIETWGFKWIRDFDKTPWSERTPYLEYTCEGVEILRDNFELDENGIAVRLPELPGLELV